MKPAASLFADVPLLAPGEKADAMPAYVVEMVAAWRAAFAAYGRHATIGAVTGIFELRAGRILGGAAVPTRAEAAAFDAALGTDTASLFPKRSASVLQSEPRPRSTTTPRSRRNHALAPTRVARVRLWEARFARYGKTYADLAREAEVCESRVWRILNSGAYLSAAEQVAFERVLGAEP